MQSSYVIPVRNDSKDMYREEVKNVVTPPHTGFAPFLIAQQRCRVVAYHQSPWSRMAWATLMKPAMLLPVTSEGSSPSLGTRYF